MLRRDMEELKSFIGDQHDIIRKFFGEQGM